MYSEHPWMLPLEMIFVARVRLLATRFWPELNRTSFWERALAYQFFFLYRLKFYFEKLYL